LFKDLQNNDIDGRSLH